MARNPTFCLIVLAVVQLSTGRPQFDFDFDFASTPPVSSSLACGLVCRAVFQPVCGSDGTTYQNDCELENSSCRGPRVQKVADNECEKSSSQRCPEACPDNSQPICGSDGNSYKNDCQLQFAACRDPTLFKVAEGDCAGTSTASSTPESSLSFAPTPSTTTTPACPQFCPVEFRPVCGNDGTTFRNECELRVAACRNPGIVKAADGSCDPLCNDDCGQAFSPVCGSDELTYTNDCLLQVATCKNLGITKVFYGRC